MNSPAAQASSPGAGRFATVRRLQRTTSTNTVALAAAAAGAPEGLVVLADEQTAGRGRLGRSWTAPPGATLLCSVLLRPPDPPDGALAFLLTACLALAARQAAAELVAVTLGCKWPNDLLAGEAKVAGILAERAPDGAVVVGIGCNLNQPAPGAPGYPPGAASLEGLAGRPVGREPFLAALLAGLERRYGAVVDPQPAGRAALLAEARGASATLGSPVRVELPGGGRLVGVAVALGDDGRLVVARPDGTEAVVEAGDVVHLRHGGAPLPRGAAQPQVGGPVEGDRVP